MDDLRLRVHWVPRTERKVIHMAKKKKSPKMPLTAEKGDTIAKRELTEDEQSRLDNYKERSKNKSVEFKKAGSQDTGKAIIDFKDRKDPLLDVKMADSFGTHNKDVQTYLIDQIASTFKGVASTDEFSVDKAVGAINNTMGMLSEIHPRDQIEGLLAIQMISVHNLAMNCVQRAMIDGQSFVGRQANVNYATKMTRTFISQMEALKKYRQGGQQKMTVEHVHVNEGGQAIVGQVNQGGAKEK